MTSLPHRHARMTTALLAIAGLLLAAVPAALASPEASHRAPDRPDQDRAGREAATDHAPAKKAAGRFTIDLAGTAVDKENRTYKVVITGEGRGRVRADANGNVTDVLGAARLRIVVTDAHGTVVKDRELRARLHGQQTSDGLVWQLHGIGKHKHGLPQLHLHGSAVRTAPGVFALEGKGGAAFAKTSTGEPLRIRIDPVAGTLTRL